MSPSHFGHFELPNNQSIQPMHPPKVRAGSRICTITRVVAVRSVLFLAGFFLVDFLVNDLKAG